MNILVVDADPSIRELLAAILSDEGYQAQTMDAPQICFERIGAMAELDMLLIEIMATTAARTLSLLAQLRQSPATQELPVLVCSTDGQLLRRLDGELRQFDCLCLLKPFEVENLLQLVRRQLRRASRPHLILD